jgi:hypothetical protein
MKFSTKIDAKRKTGLTYLGSVNKTAKHVKAYKFNELTYGLYLAPAKLSGFEVCPMRTAECTALCLNESGMNRMNMKDDMITKGRIKKTKLFFEDRQFFMEWMIHEISLTKEKARKNDYHFSVRLNNTSDISPEMFWLEIEGKKKNILEIFPDVQFYDYTKVPKRFELTKKYPNYDLTFSYSGENEKECKTLLTKGGKVAVVFKNNLPETFWNKKVVNGDEYDMRYRDESNVIVGLKFKTVRKKPEKDSKFVIH